jgi:hypothetical protein
LESLGDGCGLALSLQAGFKAPKILVSSFEKIADGEEGKIVDLGAG